MCDKHVSHADFVDFESSISLYCTLSFFLISPILLHPHIRLDISHRSSIITNMPMLLTQLQRQWPRLVVAALSLHSLFGIIRDAFRVPTPLPGTFIHNPQKIKPATTTTTTIRIIKRPL